MMNAAYLPKLTLFIILSYNPPKLLCHCFMLPSLYHEANLATREKRQNGTEQALRQPTLNLMFNKAEKELRE